MSDIVRSERQKYEDMWAVDAYNVNSPGEQLVNVFIDMVGDERGWVLDAGCGAGRGAVALRKAGFKVMMCDLTDTALIAEARDIPFVQTTLWGPLGAGDWAYCCDVLEHIPPQFTMLAISRLLEAAPRGVFLSISNVPDTYGAWIGKTLHETVQPFVWWRDNLRELGAVVEARDLLISSLFLVRPR